MPVQKLKTEESAFEKFEKEFKENNKPAVPDDSGARYLAYANRLRTALTSGTRYLAYTSDFGEAFRPVAHPYLINGSYFVSWGYVLYDVCYTTYSASKSGGTNEDVAIIGLKRAAFQSIASMMLPAFTVHNTVRLAAKPFSYFSYPRVRVYGPSAVGLAVVPLLPFIFDEPIEKIIDYAAMYYTRKEEMAADVAQKRQVQREAASIRIQQYREKMAEDKELRDEHARVRAEKRRAVEQSWKKEKNE